MASDHDRRELFEALERKLGPVPAATLMELLPAVGWGDIARQSDLTAIRGEIVNLRGELKDEMAKLRVDVKGEIADLRGEMKAQLPKLYAANVATAVAVAGLVLAAAKLA